MEGGVIERLYRRVMMVIGRGRIRTGDDSGPVQMLQVQLGADEVRDATMRMAEWGFASMPLPGADAVVVFLAGDRSNGCVIATGDNRYRLHLTPGEVAIHDDQGQKVHLTRSGIVLDGGGKSIAVQNAPQVVVTGGDVIADGISLKTHVHGGVATGAGNTGAPH